MTEFLAPNNVLQTILETGVRAPSGGNLQNYSLIVIDDMNTKNKLEMMDGFNKVSEAPIIVVAVIDYHRLQKWFHINNSEEYSVDQSSNFFIAYWDALIALHNIAITTESLSLGGYYIGNVHWYEGISDLLNLPQLTFPAGMYCLGYPDGTTKLSERLPLRAVVHRNRYHRYTDSEINTIYFREDNIWNKSPQSRKENLSKEKIYSAADFYARRKFPTDFVIKRSININKNIKYQGFKIDNNKIL